MNTHRIKSIIMNNPKIKKALSAVLIGTMVLSITPTFSDVPNTVYADELTDAKDKKQDAAAKKKEAQNKLNNLEAEKKDVMELIEELDKEISSYEGTISDLKNKRNTLQAQASIAEESLQLAYIAEANQYDSMKERIQFAYENGDAEYVEALISVKEYSNMVNQSEYVSQVSAYDQNQLNDLLEIEKNIVAYQDTINDNLTEIDELRSEAEGEQQALQVMQDGKQATLKEYNIQIADAEYTIEELAAIEAQQDATIAAIEAQAAAARKAAELAAQQAAQAAQQATSTDASDSTNDSTTTTTTTTTMASYGGGAFTWPCPSSTYITSPFGSRVSPTTGATTNHMGIDIGCAYGASVVAAASGVVTYVGYLGAGGNCVMIDHGNGLTTLYFHLSSFATSVGANVSAGTTIAYAGSTGISTGPHLHFGVRSYGAYVDPMGYL